MPTVGDTIEFNHSKHFKYIRALGSGGTGDTHLFLDETTNIEFAIKRYNSKDKERIEEHYHRFVDEIKILFALSHPNIVRIYNYYLYPKLRAGYLQMEYIQGITLDQYNEISYSTSWENIFVEAISAFKYLEQYGILHRDIRAANIMLDADEKIKIIDFGFGKKLHPDQEHADSILLNWPVSEFPEEVLKNGIYNHQSEIYFLGKLFQSLIENDVRNIETFKYNHIINKMIHPTTKRRYESFEKVFNDISLGIMGEFQFSKTQKKTYIKFAQSLSRIISVFNDKFMPLNDVKTTLNKLADVIRKSALEKIIQNNELIIDSFIKGDYLYFPEEKVLVQDVQDFYELLNSLNFYEQKIILDNINVRLSSIEIVSKKENLPF